MDREGGSGDVAKIWVKMCQAAGHWSGRSLTSGAYGASTVAMLCHYSTTTEIMGVILERSMGWHAGHGLDVAYGLEASGKIPPNAKHRMLFPTDAPAFVLCIWWCPVVVPC